MSNKYTNAYLSNQSIENDNLKFISHPYLRLAQGIVIQAVIDRDVDFLNSPQGQTLIDGLNLSQQEINYLMEKATSIKGQQNLEVQWGNKCVALKELSQQTGIRYQTLYNRIFMRGWNVDKAIAEGSRVEVKKNYTWNGKPTTLADVSRATGVSISALYNRIHKSHMTVEEAVAKGKSRRK